MITEISIGTGTAILLIVVVQLLSRFFSMKLLATTMLVAIAFIYTGFALKDNPVELTCLEISFSVALYLMAIMGYRSNNALIAWGIILHGAWDILHHNGLLVPTDVPEYWPSFCFIIDIIDGLYFLIIFRLQKRKTSKQLGIPA